MVQKLQLLTVCLFIYTAVPILIQTNICLHSTHRKVHVFLHVYFPEIVHHITFLHPFCNHPIRFKCPGWEWPSLESFSKGVSHSLQTPHFLRADTQDLRYSARRKGKLTVTSTKKNKAASFLDNHYWNCPVICTFSGSQRQTQSLATGRDATDKGGECVPACACVWDA